MEINISANGDELSLKVADWLVQYIAGVLKQSDRFTISLSGGSTPRKLFRLLASEKYKNSIEWAKLHFFWGDERFVPFADERNNARMTFEELLDLVPVRKEQVYIMRTDLSPEAAVTAYNAILHQYFKDSGPSFDLVFLGLGDNAHTLSLFPGYEVVHENEKWVTAFFLEEQDMFRITLTAAIVNRSAAVAFLVTGADKAEAVKEILEGKSDPDKYPAQVIKPVDGTLYWFLDEAAASDLTKNR
ncbi:MAG TPA: 6-phosphogluconolactonase [Chitinophagaceae bacterium]|nr:6-phosphogluconolactonase [Chitinophagaceae bacterium]